MKIETKTVYVCEFCGQEHTSQEWMQVHEEVCALNPKNQPCAQCSNLILGMGCSRGMNTEAVGGNVLCFCYVEGTPLNPFDKMQELNIPIINSVDKGDPDKNGNS